MTTIWTIESERKAAGAQAKQLERKCKTFSASAISITTNEEKKFAKQHTNVLYFSQPATN